MVSPVSSEIRRPVCAASTSMAWSRRPAQVVLSGATQQRVQFGLGQPGDQVAGAAFGRDRQQTPSLERELKTRGLTTRSTPSQPAKPVTTTGLHRVLTHLYPPRHQAGQVSSFSTYVELRGFEPLTFSMRTRRATNCAIAP